MTRFHSGGNFFQVIPPSVVWYLAFADDTVAWRASTAKTKWRSSCEGGRIFCQCAPPSVERKVRGSYSRFSQGLVEEISEGARLVCRLRFSLSFRFCPAQL